MWWTARSTRPHPHPHHADARSAQAHVARSRASRGLCTVARCVPRCAATDCTQPAACIAAGQSLRVSSSRTEACAQRQNIRVLLAGCVTRAPHRTRPSALPPVLGEVMPSLLALLSAPLAVMLCPYTRTSSCCAAVHWLRLCATYSGVVWRPRARTVAAGVAVCARRARLIRAVESACAHPVVAQTAACSAPPANCATRSAASACWPVRGCRVAPGDVRLLNRPRAECAAPRRGHFVRGDTVPTSPPGNPPLGRCRPRGGCSSAQTRLRQHSGTRASVIRLECGRCANVARRHEAAA